MSGPAVSPSDGGGLLTSMEVCQATGLSYRRLDHWTRMGHISPVVPASGSGSVRRWDPRVTATIAELCAAIDACPIDHGGHRQLLAARSPVSRRRRLEAVR